MTASLSTRYKNGEYESVTNELCSLPPDLLYGIYLEDARNVAFEIVSRCLQNLEKLHAALLSLDYEFAAPAEVIVKANRESINALDDFERSYGRLPMLARIWYEQIASINFYQSREQTFCNSTKPPPGFHGVRGLGGYANKLFLQSATDCIVDAELARREHDKWIRETALLKESSPSDVDLASLEPAPWSPRFLCGNNASNNDAKGFDVPANSFDGVFYDDGEPTTFIEELRWIFSKGVFPIWTRLEEDPAFYIPMEYRPNFPLIKEILCKDLVPV